jgi:hypothetical protein
MARDRAGVNSDAQSFTIDPKDGGVQGITQASRARCHSVEHRLNIGRRTADHPQNLARCSLSLKGFGHLRMGCGKRLVLLLQFLEQAHVLDGDDRLSREGLEQRDVSVREGSHLMTVDHDRPDQRLLAQDRHDEVGARAE